MRIFVLFFSVAVAMNSISTQAAKAACGELMPHLYTMCQKTLEERGRCTLLFKHAGDYTRVQIGEMYPMLSDGILDLEMTLTTGEGFILDMDMDGVAEEGNGEQFNQVQIRYEEECRLVFESPDFE